MALYLATPKRRSLTSPCLLRLFSTSGNGNDLSPLSSYLSDVRARLKQQQQQSPGSGSGSGSSNPPMSPSAQRDEIRKNLSQFRLVRNPTTTTTTTPTQSQQQLSFQGLYEKSFLAKQGGGDSNSNSNANPPRLDAIKASLKQLGSSSERKAAAGQQPLSLYDYTKSFQLKPSDGGGSGTSPQQQLPSSVFGRENTTWKPKEGDAAAAAAAAKAKMRFVKTYSHSELGDKLRQLRPQRKEGQQWFSLHELNERLIKLREMEEKEQSQSWYSGFGRS